MIFAVGGNFYLAMSETFRIFAVAFDSQKAVSKKSIAIILSLKIRQIIHGGLSILCFRLVVYAIPIAYLSGVRYVPEVIRSVKGVWRYLKENDEST